MRIGALPHIQKTANHFDFEDIEKTADQAGASQAALPPPETLFQLTQTGIAPERPGDVRYKDHRLLALYFDMKSMSVPDQLRALDAAQNLIRRKMTAADLMAIMEYDGAAVEVLQDFTGDRERLPAVVATMIVGEADNTGDSPPSAGASANGAAFGQDDSEFTIFNNDRKLAALQTAAKMPATLNEKKSPMSAQGCRCRPRVPSADPLDRRRWGACVRSIRARISTLHLPGCSSARWRMLPAPDEWGNAGRGSIAGRTSSH